MRKLLFLLFVLSACSKPSKPTTPTSTTTTPGGGTTLTSAKYIPNWYSNDTLYGRICDTMGLWTGNYDTIITKTVNDTSMIVYKGISYYIWWNPMLPTDSFEMDKIQYGNMAISTKNDTTGIISIGLLNGAAPHKYKNQSGTTNHQQQAVMVNIRTGTPFIAYNGFYQSRRIY